jgi:hypothetical protein
MSRLIQVLKLVGLLLISAIFSFALLDQNQAAVFVMLSLVSFLIWIAWTGGGVRRVEKDTVLIVEDAMGNIKDVTQGRYFYIPIFQTIEARMPSYPLMSEFEVDSIDTRTPKIQQIKKIRVRVSYEIVDFLTCYSNSADVKARVKEHEAHGKLQRDNLGLWTQVLNEVMHQIIDDSIRDGVWAWADSVLASPRLKLNMPSLPNQPKFEQEPYALSLNRDNLAEKVLDEVQIHSQNSGLKVHRIVFENVELDPEIIKGCTRNKQGELDDAKHKALIEAHAIREKGMAEAEVRAATVAKIIEVLINQKNISITDQMLYNIVRAAMYSDGQMIWNATMEKGANGASSVKAA